MKRIRIYNYPQCLFRNKQLTKKVIRTNKTNTGKVLSEDIIFCLNNDILIGMDYCGGGIPDSRIEYLRLNSKACELLKLVGIKFDYMDS